VLVIGADGTLATRLQPGSGLVSTYKGSMRRRTRSVAWRMVALDEATSRVVLLHQTGVTDAVDTRPGGYAGHNGCSGIVAVGVSVLSPEGASPKLATGFGELPLTIDVALSPDHERVALAVPGNGPYQGPTLIEKTLADATLATPSDCGGENEATSGQPKNQVVAVTYAPSGVLFAQTREPAAIWRSDTGTTTELSPDSPVDSGHFVFPANSGGGIANSGGVANSGGAEPDVNGYAIVGDDVFPPLLERVLAIDCQPGTSASECISDSDCGPGNACSCGGLPGLSSANRCIPAECRTSAECVDAPCLLSLGGTKECCVFGNAGLFCGRKASTCLDGGDCPGNGQACVYKASTDRFECQPLTCQCGS
jgi:hypothetical protein